MVTHPSVPGRRVYVTLVLLRRRLQLRHQRPQQAVEVGALQRKQGRVGARADLRFWMRQTSGESAARHMHHSSDQTVSPGRAAEGSQPVPLAARLGAGPLTPARP